MTRQLSSHGHWHGSSVDNRDSKLVPNVNVTPAARRGAEPCLPYHPSLEAVAFKFPATESRVITVASRVRSPGELDSEPRHGSGDANEPVRLQHGGPGPTARPAAAGPHWSPGPSIFFRFYSPDNGELSFLLLLTGRGQPCMTRMTRMIRGSLP